MAVSDAPWDGAPSQWKDTDAYCASCALDLNPAGKPKTQDNCKLPYTFPNGDISRVVSIPNGLHRPFSHRQAPQHLR